MQESPWMRNNLRADGCGVCFFAQQMAEQLPLAFEKITITTPIGEMGALAGACSTLQGL